MGVPRGDVRSYQGRRRCVARQDILSTRALTRVHIFIDVK
jgi:hypothetical protein